MGLRPPMVAPTTMRNLKPKRARKGAKIPSQRADVRRERGRAVGHYSMRPRYIAPLQATAMAAANAFYCLPCAPPPRRKLDPLRHSQGRANVGPGAPKFAPRSGALRRPFSASARCPGQPIKYRIRKCRRASAADRVRRAPRRIRSALGRPRKRANVRP